MGGKQSTNTIKINDIQRSINQLKMNVRTRGTIRVGNNQSQEHEQDATRMRNMIENQNFQQQHTLAKRFQTEKIRFK